MNAVIVVGARRKRIFRRVSSNQNSRSQIGIFLEDQVNRTHSTRSTLPGKRFTGFRAKKGRA